MKINFQKLAGAGMGAALAILLSVDVEAAPMPLSQDLSEFSVNDGLIVNVVASRVRVRRHRGVRTPRQMAHRHRGHIQRERTLTHRPQ